MDLSDDAFPYIYDMRAFSTERYPDGIVDGDTMWVELDLGFYIRHIETVRLHGVDTRETSFVSQDSEEYARGVVHTNFVRSWFEKGVEDYDGNFPFQFGSIEYNHNGKYGRALGYILRKSDGEVLNDRLLEEFDDVETYE